MSRGSSRSRVGGARRRAPSRAVKARPCNAEARGARVTGAGHSSPASGLSFPAVFPTLRRSFASRTRAGGGQRSVSGRTGCPAGASDRCADHPAHLGGMSGGAPPFDFPDWCLIADLLNWELCYLVLSQSMGESHLMPRLEVCTGVLRMSGSGLPMDVRAFERGFLYPCPRC